MKNLNTYFDKAKNLKINNAIIPNDEIRIVLGKVEKINLPKADKYNNDFIHFLRKYKMTIISSALLALSFAAFLNTNKIETTSQEKKSKDIAIVNKVTNINNTEIINKEETKETKVNAVEIKDNDSIITLPILKLTDEELSKLGINRVGNGYSFYMQSKFNLKNRKQREQLYNAGYDTTLKNAFFKRKIEISTSGINIRELVNDKTWDVFNGSKILPITYYAENIRENGGESSHGYSSDESPISELGSGDVMFEFYNLSLKNKLKFRDFYKYDSIKINKYEMRNTSQLIPIFLRLDSADTKNISALFFVPTRELLSLLPKRYSSIISRNIPCIKKLLLNKISLEELQSKNVLIINNNVKPIKMLELNKVELSKLGITLEKDSIKLLYETEIDFVNQPKMKDYIKSKGIETDLDKIYIKTATYFKFNSSIGKDSIISWSADYDRIAPIIVNTFNFEYEDNKYVNAGTGSSSKSSKLTNENDRIFVSELMKLTSKTNLENLRKGTFIDLKTNKETSLVNKLLPVKIILGDSTKKVEGNRYSEVIVWFVPTLEFVGALPDRYRSEIEAELNIIAKVESGLASQDELCKETKVGFFNICNNDNNIKSVNAYPNPVQNEINLEFKLDKKAKVSINLKDISGKIIKNLITDLYLENQSFSQKLSLEGITQGMYLLEIKSSDGSIVIQKILKN